MFLLYVFDLDEDWTVLGIYSSQEELDKAVARVSEAYKEKFNIILDKDDFSYEEIVVNQDRLSGSRL